MPVDGGDSREDCIYCIGDSHVSFFSGVEAIQPLWPRPSVNLLPFFKAFRIGPVLAYSLAAWDSKMRGREILSVLLNRNVPETEQQIPHGARVLLCFGEIDCRCHVIPRVRKSGGDVERVVDRIADRYCKAIGDVMSWGYRPLIWNVIPSSPRESAGSREYPVIGSCLERNQATRLLNQRLACWCQEHDLPFVDIYRQLVDDDGITRPEFLMDEIHLSQRTMPLVVDWLRAHEPQLVPDDYLLPNPDPLALSEFQQTQPLFPPKPKKTLRRRLQRLMRKR